MYNCSYPVFICLVKYLIEVNISCIGYFNYAH